MNRREFLKLGGKAGVAAALFGRLGLELPEVEAESEPPEIVASVWEDGIEKMSVTTYVSSGTPMLSMTMTVLPSANMLLRSDGTMPVWNNRKDE